MTTRADVVAQARQWLDVPFLHQGVSREGCDCRGLVIGVCRELGLVAPDFDVTGYPREPDGRSMLEACDRHMQRIGRDAMQPGDVIVVAFHKHPQHLGILTDHAYGCRGVIHGLGVTAQRVVETQLQFTPSMRFVAAYALPGVA